MATKELPVQWVVELFDFDKIIYRNNAEGFNCAYRDELEPGSAEWSKFEDNNIYRLLYYSCPCGCKGVGHLPVAPIGNHSWWQWNGNLLLPTLTPSILRSSSPCKWHGFLTDGIWKTC